MARSSDPGRHGQRHPPAPTGTGRAGCDPRNERMQDASRNSAFGRTALGWVNDADTGIGGRPAGAARGPDIEIVDRINDPAAEPAINRAGAVAAMLLERAWRETEMGRGIRCSHVARRNERNESGRAAWRGGGGQDG